jgi:hypothetical protein
MSDIKLFQITGSSVTAIEGQSVAVEKSLQTLLEKHLEPSWGGTAWLRSIPPAKPTAEQVFTPSNLPQNPKTMDFRGDTGCSLSEIEGVGCEIMEDASIAAAFGGSFVLLRPIIMSVFI